MHITSRHIRAAREALQWSQSQLARRAQLNQATISKLENNDETGQAETLKAISNALAAEGVFFTPNGVEWRLGASYEISGPDWWLRLLEDIAWSLKQSKRPELVLMCSDDRESSPAVVERYRALRAEGVRFRQFVREGNRYLMGKPDEYRWLAKERFQNTVTALYGDKIAVCAESNTKAVVVRDRALADSWRNMVDVMWSTLEQPDRSDADVRF